MTGPPSKLLPPLAADEHVGLKADIAGRGVIARQRFEETFA